MAGARSRRRGPTPVGRLHVLLGADAVSYVRWQPAPEVDVPAELGHVAVVTAVDWAARGTLSDRQWSRRQVRGFLERACRAGSAAAYNLRCGTSRVVRGAPPAGTVGLSVTVEVSRNEDGTFVHEWSAPPACTAVSGAERVLAALWGVAADQQHENAVRHALFALRGGFDQSGWFAPAVTDTLVASLVNFGVDMAEADARAVEARSHIRVV